MNEPGKHEYISSVSVSPMTTFSEIRSGLKKLALTHGAETPIGYAAHNLLEMTENYANPIASQDQGKLAANIARELARLEKLRKELH